jgi:hypothetical protein
LYRVTKKSWTLVVASSEEHAKVVARKLSAEAFEADNYDFRAIELRQPHEIPQPWRGALPFCHPGREHLYDNATCEEVIRHAKGHKRLEAKFMKSDLLGSFWREARAGGNGGA